MVNSLIISKKQTMNVKIIKFFFSDLLSNKYPPAWLANGLLAR